MAYAQANHLYSVLDRGIVTRLLAEAAETLKDVDFDSFVVTGHSGVIFGSLLAHQLDKKLIVVRKPGVDSHSWRSVQGVGEFKRYIFLDDLMFQGVTVKRVQDAMKDEELEGIPELVGSYFYDQAPKWRPGEDPAYTVLSNRRIYEESRMQYAK